MAACVTLVHGISGRVFNFHTPPTVAHLQTAFPHHLICPLQIDQPIRPLLVPHATLKPGNLYLLRPYPQLKRALSEEGEAASFSHLVVSSGELPSSCSSGLSSPSFIEEVLDLAGRRSRKHLPQKSSSKLRLAFPEALFIRRNSRQCFAFGMSSRSLLQSCSNDLATVENFRGL